MLCQAAPVCQVLVVEDDGDNGQLFVDLLEFAGYAATLVATGWAAIDVICSRAAHFDAVILDFDLLDMTAREVLAATEGYRQHLPVLLVSANRDVPALARELAVASFVAKPFPLAQLLSRLERCIADA
jgi:two-component system, OmpR family, response regulator